MYQPGLSAPTETRINICRLSDALRAEYQCSEFDCTVRPEHRVDAIVDEPVSLSLGVYGGSVKYHVVRKPADEPSNMACTIAGNRMVCRKPGLYVVAIELDGGFRREVEIVCWPKAAVAAVGFSAEMALARRRRLRAITRDAHVSRQSVIDALETPRQNDKHPVFGESFPTATFATFVGRTPQAGIALDSYGGRDG